MPLIINFLRVILGPFIKWLGLAFSSILPFFKGFLNTSKSLLLPLFNFFIEHWLKILIWGIFGSIALNLVSTLFAYVLYTLSVAIHLALSNYVTEFTVTLIVNSILGLLFIITGGIIFKLFS